MTVLSSMFAKIDPTTLSWRMLGATISAILLPFILTGLYTIRHIRNKPHRKHVAFILVLGDMGRSPRMMYHASSFARHDWEAVLVGYDETPLMPSLLETPHIHPRGIATPPALVMKLPWIIRAPVRILYQVFSVLQIAFFVLPVHPEVIMVQNPPSIPTLALAWIIARVTKAKLIIDWHNTGYSILAMRTGEHSILVRIAKWFESYFGRTAYAHLFVTKALEKFLADEWALEGYRAVLHDRPPTHFTKTGAIHQADLCRRLIPELVPPLPESFLPGDATQPETAFTILKAGMPELREDRPALLLSSTSWTADEDFTLLLTALDEYQQGIKSGRKLPKLLVVITGKGALRRPFELAVKAREGSTWTDICVRCHFLPAKDYPTLLGCADLGVSLHTSSSGRDLPMKVVDMFGCGLPVLAKGFGCIDELVKHGENGLVFDSGEELGEQIIDTLAGFPHSAKLDKLQNYFTEQTRKNGASTPTSRSDYSRTEELDDEWTTWDENWDRVVYNGIVNKQHFRKHIELE